MTTVATPTAAVGKNNWATFIAISRTGSGNIMMVEIITMTTTAIAMPHISIGHFPDDCPSFQSVSVTVVGGL